MSISRRELMQGIVAGSLTASFLGELRAESGIGAKRRIASGHILGKEHPRLYLSHSTLPILKERFRTDTDWANGLLAAGKLLLAQEFIPEVVAERGGGQQANYGEPAKQIAWMGLTLGLLYQLTGDTQYAVKLHNALRYYGQYVRWGGQGLAGRNPPWHSELDTGQFCFGFANGYDTLYHYLSEQQREQVKSDMIRLGILPTLNDWISPGTRFHSLDSMGHNWWGVCVANAGVASLVLLGEDPRAAQWVDRIDSGFVQWFTYGGNALHNRIETFEADGPSYEGVNYTIYGVSNYLRYLLAWKNVFPERKPATDEFLKGISEFFLHTLYPASSGSLSVNFDDCPLNADADETVLLLLACGIDDEYARAFLRYSRGHLQDPLPLYLKRPPQQPSVPLPLSRVYPKMGWAMMRSSWENDATLLAVKSGYTWNHAHADASTFLLMHRGSPLIIDSGTCPYGRPEYSTYYRQSQAHNVVLFNGHGQPIDQIDIGSKFRGSILKWCDGLGVRYLAADATGPMALAFTRHYRHFLWIENVILIFDDIAAASDGQLDWLLHTAGSAQSIGAGRLSLRNGNASADFAMLYPSTEMEVRQGLAEEHPDRKIPYNVFTAATRNHRQRFISAIDLEPSSPSQVEVREEAEYLEVSLQHGGERHFIYLNLRSIDGSYARSSTISIGDWSTDAYISMFSIGRGESPAEPENTKRFLQVDGSFLRWRTRSMMESLSKGDCLWNQGPRMEVFSQGQKNLSYSVYAGRLPARVFWNRAEIEPSYDSDRHLLHLQSFVLPA